MYRTSESGDGHGVGRWTETTLAERRALRDNGVITVLAIVDLTAKTLAEPLVVDA